MLETHRCRKASRSNCVEERNNVCGDQLSDSEQIEAKGMSKGGWEAMECDRKPGSISWTDVACQPLFPGETPMHQLRVG